MGIFAHLKHQYIFTSGKIHISTKGFANDFSEIESETILQTPDEIIRFSKYPNGFEMLFIQNFDKIIVKTNLPLIEVSSGEFEVQFD